jgi:hypothetical protein
LPKEECDDLTASCGLALDQGGSRSVAPARSILRPLTRYKGRGCLEPQTSGSRSLMRAPSCFGPRFLAESVEASDYLDPFAILIIQHDTDDQLCAVRRRLSSEEPGDPLEDAPKDALPPRPLCGLFTGAALEHSYPDYSVIHW